MIFPPIGDPIPQNTNVTYFCGSTYPVTKTDRERELEKENEKLRREISSLQMQLKQAQRRRK